MLLVFYCLLSTCVSAGKSRKRASKGDGHTGQVEVAEIDALRPRVLSGAAHYDQSQFRYLLQHGHISDFCKHDYEKELSIKQHIIGKGGFGIIYKGSYKAGGQSIPVAVKFMTLGHDDKAQVLQEIYFLQKFKGSRTLMSQISCFFERAEDRLEKLKKLELQRQLQPEERKEKKSPRNKAIIVMPLMSSDLAKWIFETAKTRGIGNEELAEVMLGCARAVSELHEQGITHRDIKPQNFLLSPDNHIYLADFGVSSESKVMKGKVGTQGFMAPELFKPGSYSKAVDIYALGVTFYILAAQRYPRASGTRLALADSDFPPGSPFASLVRKMTAASPGQRLKLDDVIATLESIKGNPAQGQKRAGPSQPQNAYNQYPRARQQRPKARAANPKAKPRPWKILL